ncbi:Hypothetical protein CAP_8590 [Chondromyces apiculatus DSM 436]|uniref:Uncharacterized protein n=1 Tax=Chondromyces apiculatus DSM 436 TaxID=1192034 RepID=A0A017SWN5_9BACT|nr:Hypothetical protein CAP_8590 [Chondromyces apiculatus DSM 436]
MAPRHGAVIDAHVTVSATPQRQAPRRWQRVNREFCAHSHDELELTGARGLPLNHGRKLSKASRAYQKDSRCWPGYPRFAHLVSQGRWQRGQVRPAAAGWRQVHPWTPLRPPGATPAVQMAATIAGETQRCCMTGGPAKPPASLDSGEVAHRLGRCESSGSRRDVPRVVPCCYPLHCSRRA